LPKEAADSGIALADQVMRLDRHGHVALIIKVLQQNVQNITVPLW